VPAPWALSSFHPSGTSKEKERSADQCLRHPQVERIFLRGVESPACFAATDVVEDREVRQH